MKKTKPEQAKNHLQKWVIVADGIAKAITITIPFVIGVMYGEGDFFRAIGVCVVTFASLLVVRWLGSATGKTIAEWSNKT